MFRALLLLCFFVIVCHGKLRIWQVEKRRWEYDVYHKCIKKIGQDIKHYTLPMKASTVLKGSTIELECFPWYVFDLHENFVMF